MPAFRIGKLPSGVARKGAVAAAILALLMGCFVTVGILLPGSIEVTRFRPDQPRPRAPSHSCRRPRQAWDGLDPWARPRFAHWGTAQGHGGPPRLG